jgi:hypothetical protein
MELSFSSVEVTIGNLDVSFAPVMARVQKVYCGGMLLLSFHVLNEFTFI